MEHRDLPEKYRIISGSIVSTQATRGAALFIVMMGLMLVSGLGLFVLENGTTQLQIARYTQKEITQNALMDSGIDLALSWYRRPEGSPNPAFFNRKCGGDETESPLTFDHEMEIGGTLSFEFSKLKDRCRVRVRDPLGRNVEVFLTSNPMPPVLEDLSFDKRDQDSEREKETPKVLPFPNHEIKRFVKRFGRYLTISKNGLLEENGVEVVSFDSLFANGEKRELVYIDNHGTTIHVGKGPYTGYFYFSGPIEIEGGTPHSINFNRINLDGFFYTNGEITLRDVFSVHGAIYAGRGLTGEGVDQLDIEYNEEYRIPFFEDVVPLIPQRGTYKGQPYNK